MVASAIVACKTGAWLMLSSRVHVVISKGEANGDEREDLGYNRWSFLHLPNIYLDLKSSRVEYDTKRQFSRYVVAGRYSCVDDATRSPCHAPNRHDLGIWGE